jgi:hypothetical protein
MSGYNLVREIHQLEQKVEALGFMFCSPKNYTASFSDDLVALKPRDESSVPVYARDAEVFVGSLAQLRQWLLGVAWARDYDRMLNVSNDQKRAQGEDRYRASVEKQRIEQEKKQMWKILKEEKSVTQ